MTLPVAGPVAVEVASFNGDVTIEADPGIRTAIIEVSRTSLIAVDDPDVEDVGLDSIWIRPEVVPGDLGQVLLVTTGAEHPDRALLRTHLTILLPDIEDVTVRTTNGDVRLVDVAGTIHVETTNGDVAILTTRPLVKPVTVLDVNGDITYRVRGESSGRFDCRSIRGRVVRRMLLGRVVVDPGSDRSTLLATLNKGRNPVVLRTVDGDIHVMVVERPTKVGRIFLD